MKIEIQKVIVKVPLAEFAESYQSAGDPILHVWVNIPRALLQKREELDTEYTRLYFDAEIQARNFREKYESTKDRERLVRENEKEQDAIQAKLEDYKLRSHAWFSELWSQGPENTRWPVDDIIELENSDHMLLGWMADKTRELLRTRRLDQKNA